MANPVILIIEDDPLLTKMYRTKFEMEGYDVIVAEDGQIGIDELTKQVPDFIVLDLMMPRVSGIEVLERLKVSPVFKDIPVMVLTNMTRDEERQRAVELGAVEFVLKADFTPTQVVEKIKGYLSVN